MSQLKEFSFPSVSERDEIYVRCRLPEGPVVGTVQIAHGISEYIGRYDGFMELLAGQGFAVYGNDHLGHGKSVTNGRYGYIGDQQGWDLLLGDLLQLHGLIVQTHPGVPHFLFGHSMGSFLARSFLIRQGELLDGCILCGTGHPPTVQLLGARALARVELLRRGPGQSSPLLDAVMNRQYNGGYANPRTDYDWISSDPERVDEYMADPLCGQPATVGLMQQVLDGMWEITRPKKIQNIPKDLPMLFIAGAEDPVGELGAGVRRAYEAFLQAGMEDVSIRLYPGLRHELLLEPGGGQALEDVSQWLQEKIS